MKLTKQRLKEIIKEELTEKLASEGKWVVYSASDALKLRVLKVVKSEKEALQWKEKYQRSDKWGAYGAVPVPHWNKSVNSPKIKEGKLSEGRKFKYKKNDWKKYNQLVKKGKSVMIQTAFGDEFAWEDGSNYGVFGSESDGREIELSHDDIDQVEIF